MSRKRSIMNRGKKKQEKVMDLDITSLLDVLVILLVFLLKSFSAASITSVPDGINLPNSESQKMNQPGVVVQVSPTKIWVDDKIIVDTMEKSPVYDQSGKRLIPLYEILVHKRELVQQIEKSSKEAKKFTGKINFVMDKELKYNYLRKILHTAAEAGYPTYQFIVLGED